MEFTRGQSGKIVVNSYIPTGPYIKNAEQLELRRVCSAFWWRQTRRRVFPHTLEDSQ